MGTLGTIDTEMLPERLLEVVFTMVGDAGLSCDFKSCRIPGKGFGDSGGQEQSATARSSQE